jgi:hypothetical protein
LGVVVGGGRDNCWGDHMNLSDGGMEHD